MPAPAGDIVVGGGFVRARTSYTSLAKIDSTTNEIVDPFVEARGFGGVELGFGSVWLSDFTTNRVWRLSVAAD